MTHCNIWQRIRNWLDGQAIVIVRHEDWEFDPENRKHPFVKIPGKAHGLGQNVTVELPVPLHKLPRRVEKNGDIIIIRNNFSFGNFDDLVVRIHRKAQFIISH